MFFLTISLCKELCKSTHSFSACPETLTFYSVFTRRKKEKKSGMFEIPTSGKLQKMHSIGDVAHKYISTFF